MWNREPVAVVALIEAVVILAVAFGVDLSAEQMAAIMAVVVAFGAVVQRSQVSPVGGS